MIDDEEAYRHYALNVPLYTHFTSPIRRYSDVMALQLVAECCFEAVVLFLHVKPMVKLSRCFTAGALMLSGL